MRNRNLVTFLLALVLVAAFAAPAAAADGFLLAQPEGDAEQGGENVEEGIESGTTGGDTEEGEGQEDPGAQTDPGAGEDAETETGPPWTYQMARIGLVLLVFLGLAIGLAWYRFVGSRQRVA